MTMAFRFADQLRDAGLPTVGRALVAATLATMAVVGCSSSSGEADPAAGGPNILEPIRVAASSKTKTDLKVAIWGVTATDKGVSITTGYDAKGQPQAQVTETNTLTASGTGVYEFAMIAPREAVFRIEGGGARNKITVTNTFAPADAAILDAVRVDLARQVAPLGGGATNLTGKAGAIHPASALYEAAELVHKIGECLYSNKGCLLALGRAGASLAAVGAFCSAAGVDGVALVGCTVALAFGCPLMGKSC